MVGIQVEGYIRDANTVSDAYIVMGPQTGCEYGRWSAEREVYSYEVRIRSVVRISLVALIRIAISDRGGKIGSGHDTGCEKGQWCENH